jgi:hypothetical protein
MRSPFATIYLLATLFIAFGACHKTIYAYEPPAENSTAKPEMLFITFAIRYDSIAQKSKITLTEWKSTEGKIKSTPPEVRSKDRIVVSLLDENRTVLVTETHEHPLFRSIEYANEKGELSRKTLNLKESDFFVRIKLPTGTRWIVAEEIIDNKKMVPVEFSLTK